MDAEPRLRQICLALPETAEKQAWGDPTFRVRDRIFAMVKRGDGRLSVWMKAPDGAQEVLTAAAPDLFFRPPYVGHKGWIGIRLDDGPDWDEVARHVARSYALIAPKRLAKLMERRHGRLHRQTPARRHPGALRPLDHRLPDHGDDPRRPGHRHPRLLRHP